MKTKPTEEDIKEAADRAEGKADTSSFEFKKTAGEDDAKPHPTFDVDWPERRANLTPKKGSMLNVRKAVDAMGHILRYDSFLRKYTIAGDGLNTFVGTIDDAIARKWREVCHQQTWYEPGKEAAIEGLMRAAEENTFNSLQEHLKSLKWDGVPRVRHWTHVYLGAADIELHQVWGILFLRAMCARAFEPGCKFDHILVLEGPEGGGKSSVFRILANGKPPRSSDMTYFKDSPILHLREREQQELCGGVWLYELAELAGLRKSDSFLVKRFVTAQEDTARAAYDHFSKAQPRTPVFGGTFNTDPNTGEISEYLHTGDYRRWWSMLVGVIDLAMLHRDRDQLLAETMAPYLRTGKFGTLALPPRYYEAAKAVQKAREITDPLVDRLADLYHDIRKAEKTKSLPDGSIIEPDRDFIVDDTEVWVSASLVMKLCPGLQDGRRASGAMAANDWRKVNDRRAGTRKRGYVHAIV